jgi:hypothetical protein
MKSSRNLWPLGIIMTFVIFISGTVGLVVMACHHSVDLVSANYYEQEIKYQSRIDSQTRAQRLGASVVYDAADRHLVISLPASQATKNATGRIQLYRPSAAELDQEFKLEPAANGSQILDAAGWLRGLWKIRVSWNVEGQDYFLDQQILIGAS